MKKVVLLICALLSLNIFAVGNNVIQEIVLSDGRVILANELGMSLYTFDIDSPGVSKCSQSCLQVWPALIVNDESDIPEGFGAIRTKLGTLHLTSNNMPLYLFVGDQNPGDINGDNLQNVWHLVELI